MFALLSPRSPKCLPLTIGKFCHIGKNCVIESVSIGLGVIIGDNCVLVRFEGV